MGPARLSGFTTLPPRGLTALYELDAALRPAAGIEPSILPPVDLLGRRFCWAHAFPMVGHVGGPDGEDATEQLLQNLGRRGLVALTATFELINEWTMLTGPSEEQLPQLQAMQGGKRRATRPRSARTCRTRYGAVLPHCLTG